MGHAKWIRTVLAQHGFANFEKTGTERLESTSKGCRYHAFCQITVVSGFSTFSQVGYFRGKKSTWLCLMEQSSYKYKWSVSSCWALLRAKSCSSFKIFLQVREVLNFWMHFPKNAYTYQCIRVSLRRFLHGRWTPLWSPCSSKLIIMIL